MRFPVALAASYIRTDPEGALPPKEAQMAAIAAYAAGEGYDLVARYEDLDAPASSSTTAPASKRR